MTYQVATPVSNGTKRALVYCTFDGIGNFYHGIGTQARALLSCLAHRRSALTQQFGEFDTHILIQDLSYPRPDYTVDPDVLSASLDLAARACARIWELHHDGTRLFHLDKWHQLCAAAARVIRQLTETYDEILVIAVDAVYCVLASHLDEQLGPRLWRKVQLVYFLGSSSRIPGTTHTPGREEAEVACVDRANEDERVFLADIGSYFSRHLVEEFGLNPARLCPYSVAQSLDDENMRPQARESALSEVWQRGIPLDRPIVLSFGRADPIKGFDLAIRAVAPLRSQLHFVLIAAPYTPDDPEISRYRSLLADSGLRYTFFPQFERSLPRSLCALAETFAVLSSSIGEPCGQMPQEIPLWAGDPGPVMIVPDTGGLIEQIDPGVTGLAYRQGSIEDMTRQVVRALSMGDHDRRQMLEAARPRVLRERDLGTAIAEFLGAFWTIAGVPPAAES